MLYSDRKLQNDTRSLLQIFIFSSGQLLDQKHQETPDLCLWRIQKCLVTDISSVSSSLTSLSECCANSKPGWHSCKVHGKRRVTSHKELILFPWKTENIFKHLEGGHETSSTQDWWYADIVPLLQQHFQSLVRKRFWHSRRNHWKYHYTVTW